MPSHRISRSESALSALAFAANIARDATEGVPIVNQILGVSARILSLSEQMDNDFAALSALAQSSLALAQRIEEVVRGRTPGTQLETSLVRALSVLRSTEQLARRYTQRGRFRRALSRAFSLPRHAQRLTGEVADAVQEVIIVAALDTNMCAQENMRSSNGFRRLHHYEVEKLDPFLEAVSPDGTLAVRYHKARIDGQLLVVRYLEGDENKPACDAVLSQDAMLEALSTVQKSHPNVARVYGRSTDGAFVALRSGFLPFRHVHARRSLTTERIVLTAMRLLDAMCHLKTHGIAWRPHHVTDFLLDERGEPTIGLLHDLRDLSKMPEMLRDQLQPANAAALFCRALVHRPYIPINGLDSRIDWLLGEGANVSGECITFLRSECADRPALGPETVAHLRGRNTARNAHLWMWKSLFLALSAPTQPPAVEKSTVLYSPGVYGFSDTLCGCPDYGDYAIRDVHGLDTRVGARDGARGIQRSCASVWRYKDTPVTLYFSLGTLPQSSPCTIAPPGLPLSGQFVPLRGVGMRNEACEYDEHIIDAGSRAAPPFLFPSPSFPFARAGIESAVSLALPRWVVLTSTRIPGNDQRAATSGSRSASGAARNHAGGPPLIPSYGNAVGGGPKKLLSGERGRERADGAEEADCRSTRRRERAHRVPAVPPAAILSAPSSPRSSLLFVHPVPSFWAGVLPPQTPVAAPILVTSAGCSCGQCCKADPDT